MRLDDRIAQSGTAEDESLCAAEGTMRAVRLNVPGGLDGLAIEEIAVPAPGTGEALVRVHAASLTRDELGWPADRLPAIPSYELSGVVVRLGPGADGPAIGAPVFALTEFDRDGVAAEYAAVPVDVLALKPTALDHVESSAVPLAALSAWQGLFAHGHLEAGQRVLVHGAAGGVGHFATQLARRRGAFVLGTSSHARQGLVRKLGADVAIGYEDFEEAVEPVHLVFDTVGGAVLERSLPVVRDGGWIVSVAHDPPVPRAGSGVETVYFVVEPNRAQLERLAELIDSGDVRPMIDSVFTLSDAHAAFERSMAPGKSGKVVIRVVDE